MSIVEHLETALEQAKALPEAILTNREQVVSRLESTLVEVKASIKNAQRKHREILKSRKEAE